MAPKLTNPRKVRNARDTEKLLQLEKAGLTYPQMAEAIGRSASECHRLLAEYRTKEEQRKEPLASKRQKQIDRANALILAHWEKRDQPSHAKIIQEAQKLIISLEGLEQTKKLDVAHAVDLGDDAKTLILGGLARLAAGSGADQSDPKPDAGSGDGSPVRVAGFLGETKAGSA